MIIFLSILLLIFFVDYKMDHFFNNVLEYEPGLQDTTAECNNEERIHIVSPQSTSYAFCPSLIKELPQWIENLAEHHPQSRENRNHNCEKNIQHDPIICAVLEVMLRKIFEKQECLFHFLLTILSFRSNIPRQLLLEAASPFTINKLLNKIQTYCILVTCLSSSCIAPTMDWAVIQQESSSIDNADFEGIILLLVEYLSCFKKLYFIILYEYLTFSILFVLYAHFSG